jgi:hypothetical protein
LLPRSFGRRHVGCFQTVEQFTQEPVIERTYSKKTLERAFPRAQHPVLVAPCHRTTVSGEIAVMTQLVLYALQLPLDTQPQSGRVFRQRLRWNGGSVVLGVT